MRSAFNAVSLSPITPNKFIPRTPYLFSASLGSFLVLFVLLTVFVNCFRHASELALQQGRASSELKLQLSQRHALAIDRNVVSVWTLEQPIHRFNLRRRVLRSRSVSLRTSFRPDLSCHARELFLKIDVLRAVPRRVHIRHIARDQLHSLCRKIEI